MTHTQSYLLDRKIKRGADFVARWFYILFYSSFVGYIVGHLLFFIKN